MGIFTFQDDGKFQTFRKEGRHILEAVHRQVRTVFQHRAFQFFDKKPFTSNFSQGTVKNQVSLGFENHQFHRDVRMLF